MVRLQVGRIIKVNETGHNYSVQLEARYGGNVLNDISATQTLFNRGSVEAEAVGQVTRGTVQLFEVDTRVLLVVQVEPYSHGEDVFELPTEIYIIGTLGYEKHKQGCVQEYETTALLSPGDWITSSKNKSYIINRNNGQILIHSGTETFESFDPSGKRISRSCVNEIHRTGHSNRTTEVLTTHSDLSGTTRFGISAHRDAPPFAMIDYGYFGLEYDDNPHDVPGKDEEALDSETVVRNYLDDNFETTEPDPDGDNLPGIRFRIFKNPERKKHTLPKKDEPPKDPEVTFEFKIDTDGNIGMFGAGWVTVKIMKYISLSVVGNFKVWAKNVYHLAVEYVRSRRAQ